MIALACVLIVAGLAGLAACWVARGYHRRSWWQEWFDDVFGPLP